MSRLMGWYAYGDQVWCLAGSADNEIGPAGARWITV